MQKELCDLCEHYTGDFTCLAYPTRIPDRILTGSNDHVERQPDQIGDFTFKQRDWEALYRELAEQGGPPTA